MMMSDYELEQAWSHMGASFKKFQKEEKKAAKKCLTYDQLLAVCKKKKIVPKHFTAMDMFDPERRFRNMR